MERCEYEVAGQRGFDSNLCGFLVARFTNQNHVRVLPEKCPEDAREIKSDIAVRLDLA